ncbi:Zinc finger protein 862 [Merluccius polli]|uniref:Zinc finger protein 862 n=1 Tax=Merluccius polli TaxID=89951 RepID=A0AA47P1G9_MERPO|nr:Zinc finger protein 862 [Merluccius polli]
MDPSRPKRGRSEESKNKRKDYDKQRNQTRVNIGRAYAEWRQLRDSEECKTDADLAVLLLKFAKCNTAAVQDEWRQLKVLVSQNFRDKTNTGLWQMLLTKDSYKQEYKNILELVKIMLVLPISAAQCERGFSAQNRIKNSTRSSLAVSTTEDLMRISLEGPSVEEFDPTPAVDRWLTSKRARRPDYKSCWDDILCV